MDLSFDEWLMKLDQLFVMRYGVSSNWATGYNWLELFEDNLSPYQALSLWRTECGLISF